MALDAGSVYAVLGGRFVPTGFTQFDAAVKRSTARATEMEAASKRSSGAMALMGTAARTTALAGVAALGYGLTKSVQAAMKFDEAMAEVQAVTKAIPKDFQALRKAALDMGASTGVGATKAAGALAELAKGGLTTEQTIGALRGTIAMSQAGSMDLATAATTVAQALNLFAMKGSDASHVADAFATAANKTTADVGFFAQGLAQGGAAAKAAGLSFDETTAALEILAANGFKSGSDAGTSLKTAMIQMVKPSKMAAEKAKELGLEFFTSSGNMKSLASISSMLRDKLGGLTREQRLNAAATLVGTDGMRALMALYDQGPSKVRAFQQGLAQQGSAQDMANDKLNSLAGSLQRAGAQFESLKIKVGDALTPSLKSAADSVGVFFSSLNRGDLRATGFGRLVSDFAKAASPVVGVLAAIADAAAFAARAMARVKLIPDAVAAEAGAAAKAIHGIKNALDDLSGARPKPLQITAKLRDQVTGELIRIQSTKLAPKVARILANSASVDRKIMQLRALGINGPTARFLAERGSVDAAIAALSAQMVTIPTRFASPPPLGALPPRAAGRAAGNAEMALVGEGRGPEWVGNAQTGFSRVSGATVTALGADDYVIPTERAYRGRALDLIASAFGLEGYAKGKKPKKKRKPKPGTYVGGGDSVRYIPKAWEPLKASPDDLRTQYDAAKERVDNLERTAKEKGDDKKKSRARAKAQLPEARKRAAKLRALYRQAKSYSDRIKKQEDLVEIARNDMTLATTDAQFNEAKGRRTSAFAALIKLLQNAASHAPRGSQWQRDLLKRLGQGKIDQRENATLEREDEGAQESTYTTAEQTRLDELDAMLATAELTQGTADDLMAAQQLAGFLGGIFAAVGAGQGRGGAKAVAQIARDLKSARDRVDDLTKSPEKTADQQAVEEQARNRERIAAQNANVDRLLGAVFGGGGSGALASTQVVFQSYVPPSPQQARQLADYTVGGIAYQGGRQAPSTKVGV